MTTIVYDGELIACDSQVTSGNVKGKAQKYHFTEEGELLIVAGRMHVLGDVVEALKSGAPLEFADEETLIVEIGKRGVRVHSVDDGEPDRWSVHGPEAWGSGATAALAGLALGLRADEAVALATEVDLYSSGPVHCWNAKTLKAVKPRKLRRFNND